MKPTLTRRLFALLLAAIIVVGAIPFTAIPASATTTTDDLVYEIVDGEVTITGYIGNATELEIPATIENHPVTTIKGAFAQCHNLTTIIIPDSVTNIGSQAFWCCTSLTNIEIPAGVTSIGEMAFCQCTSLTNIEIPTGVISIGNYAFLSCTSLTSITISNSVTSIGYEITRMCDNLVSLTVDSNNSTYYSEGNCIITKATNTLIIGCSASIIPKGVTTIGSDAFSYCTNLTNISLHEGVTKISEWSFGYCTNLTNIKISIGVSKIDDGAFFECNSLTTVYYDGTEDQWNKIEIGSYNSCLTNANIIFTSTEEPELPVFIYGDIDGNDSINGKDSYYLSYILAGNLSLEEGSAEYLAADLDGDGIVNAKDANILKRIIAGAIQI